MINAIGEQHGGWRAIATKSGILGQGCFSHLLVTELKYGIHLIPEGQVSLPKWPNSPRWNRSKI